MSIPRGRGPIGQGFIFIDLVTVPIGYCHLGIVLQTAEHDNISAASLPIPFQKIRYVTRCRAPFYAGRGIIHTCARLTQMDHPGPKTPQAWQSHGDSPQHTGMELIK
jgi:hypothetical protein